MMCMVHRNTVFSKEKHQFLPHKKHALSLGKLRFFSARRPMESLPGALWCTAVHSAVPAVHSAVSAVHSAVSAVHSAASAVQSAVCTIGRRAGFPSGAGQKNTEVCLVKVHVSCGA